MIKRIFKSVLFVLATATLPLTVIGCTVQWIITGNSNHSIISRVGQFIEYITN